MQDKKITVKMKAHAFNAFMERAGIGNIDSAIDILRKNLSFGNLAENNNEVYLNFPFAGCQMPLVREEGHYVAKTFVKTFGTDKGKEVKIEYIF
jgi:hypothetical protein